MKVYAIQIGNKFVGTSAKPFKVYSYRDSAYTLETVDDVESARHYIKKHQAGAYLRRLKKQVSESIDYLKKDIENKNQKIKSGSNYYGAGWTKQQLARSEEHLKRCETLLDDIEATGSVYELEIEEEYSNTAKNRKKEIKFNPWGNRKVEIMTPTTSHKFCKKCGVKAKNIPVAHFSYGNTTDICVFCMRELAGDVERAYQAMDEDFRQHVETARFMERM